jgi:hypothetical protein
MEMLYFTGAAILLYLVSDWILNQIEIRRGARFENRSLIFFIIILVLAIILFNTIRHLHPGAKPPTSAPDTPGTEVTGDGPH